VKYHFCSCDTGAAAECVAGSDTSGNGTIMRPWKSISKAFSRWSTMAQGDTIALCKGGRWNSVGATGNWARKCGAGASTCDVRDYAPPWGSGDEGQPTIALATTSTDLFKLRAGASHLRIFNLAITGGEWPFVTADDVSHIDTCNVTLDGNDIGFYVGVSDASTHDITLRQSVITNARSQGYLGACDGCVVDGNLFDNNGAAGNNRDHGIYVGQNPLPDGSYHLNVGMRVTNNAIHRSAAGGRSCAGVELVVHGSNQDLLIENNLITELPGTATGGCYGISVGSGRDVVARFPGLVIRRNRLFHVGVHGIDFAAAPRAIIEDNVIVCTGPPGDAFHAIQVGEPCTVVPGSDCLSNVTVRNNTVLVPRGAHGGFGIALDTEGAGHIVTGNVVVSYSDQTQEPWRCMNNGLPATSYALVDRNACWQASGSNGAGVGTNVIGGGAPPLLTRLFVAAGSDPATADFTPAASSPLYGTANSDANCTVRGLAHQACSSTLAINASTWASSDPAKARVRRPTDIGSYER
jgi:hypothetical protein